MREEWFFGGDTGLRSDNSACAGVRARCKRDELPTFDVVDLLELQPKRGAPLKPSQVATAFAAMVKARRASSIALDSFYVEAFRELLAADDVEIVELPGGQSGKIDQHMLAKRLLSEKRLRFPVFALRLKAQMRDLVAKPTSGGGLSITAPRRKGNGHSDLASAVIAAVWHAHEHFSTDDDHGVSFVSDSRYVSNDPFNPLPERGY